MFLASRFCTVSGIGRDEYDIASFDKALVESGLGDYNLVRVSSIIPPAAKYVTNIDYPKGSVLFTAYAKNSTKLEQMIASAVVAAIPHDIENVGVIMEYSCNGTKDQATSIATSLAVDALNRRGINKYDLFVKSVEAQGKHGLITTTFAAIALM